MIPDEAVARIEDWLAQGKIWRYASVDQIAGTDVWSRPEPIKPARYPEAKEFQVATASIGRQMFKILENVWFRNRFVQKLCVRIDEAGDPYILLRPKGCGGLIYSVENGVIGVWIKCTGRANNLKHAFPALKLIPARRRRTTGIRETSRAVTDANAQLYDFDADNRQIVAGLSILAPLNDVIKNALKTFL